MSCIFVLFRLIIQKTDTRFLWKRQIQSRQAALAKHPASSLYLPPERQTAAYDPFSQKRRLLSAKRQYSDVPLKEPDTSIKSEICSVSTVLNSFVSIP